MSGESTRDEIDGVRRSNYDLLHDIFDDVHSQNETLRQHGETLAALSVQMSSLMDAVRGLNAQLATLVSRVDSGEREMIHFRARLDALEQRPIALSAEQHSDLLRSTRSSEMAIGELQRDLRDARRQVDTIEAKPIFTPDEQGNIRRILGIVLRRDLQDVMTQDELKAVRRIIEDWLSDRLVRTTHRQNVVIYCLTIVSILIGLASLISRFVH